MAKLTPVFLDYETFWSQDHSLTKMSPLTYVMHPETELISVAIKIGNGPTTVVFGEEAIIASVRSIDWSNKLCLAHNNEAFDSLISAWRVGIKPAMWGCTLAMARPHHAKTAGGSLKALSEHYQLGIKDSTALVNTKGRHLKDFTRDEIDAMRVYNAEDTVLCAKLFQKLLPLTSKQEMKLIDMTIRMLVEPKFELDRPLLQRVLAEEQIRKGQMLLELAKQIGVFQPGMEEDDAIQEVRTTLGSAAKFGWLLTGMGVEVPTKISVTTGKEAPALAKTDEGFLALLESDNPLVVAAAEARLGVKSTLLESRIAAFLEASDVTGGKLPIPTKYYGADTTGRRSGFLFNPLNLPRVSGKPSDCLRNSMKAPEGYKVVVADLAGIELRVNHFLWRVPSSMALYERDPHKADLYKEFASKLYNKPQDEVTKAERQFAKICQLGMGYGAGAGTFRKIAKMMGGVTLDAEGARSAVATWRGEYAEIARGWKTCHAALAAIYQNVEQPIDPWGLCHTCAEGIRTPNGMIRYPKLRQEINDEGKAEWLYGEGRHKARIYAGKVDENVIQSLARQIICGHALEIKRLTGHNPALEVYDELVYIIPESEAAQHLDTVLTVMKTAPSWWPELVLSAEGDIADTYGAAK